MKIGYKILIGSGVALTIGGIAYFTRDSWMPKKDSGSKKSNPDGSNNANEIMSHGSATNNQFEMIADTAKAVGSDLFETTSASQLSSMRNTFTSKLSYNEGEKLNALLKKKASDWSVSDKIDFDTLLKKWKGTRPTVTTNPVAPTPKVVPPPYDILADTDYDIKASVLDIWRDSLLQKEKKGLAGLFQKNVPEKKGFYKKFMPLALADMKSYSSAQAKDKNDRSVKEETVLYNIRKKYPHVFNGVTKIYSFDGTSSELANADLITL